MESNRNRVEDLRADELIAGAAGSQDARKGMRVRLERPAEFRRR